MLSWRLNWSRMESARLNELQRSIKNMKNEASVQHWKDEKWKRATIVIYIYIKWMTRLSYLKLLTTTTFIQYCWRQLLARKELLRLKQEANEMITWTLLELRVQNLKFQ
jgi:hypothetical protein